jgi:hypothetical protein
VGTYFEENITVKKFWRTIAMLGGFLEGNQIEILDGKLYGKGG